MVEFKAYGHENILATHRNTLEITKDKDLTKQGDCIVGVNSDFLLSDITEILKQKKAKLILEVDGLKEEVNFEINPNFCDEHEIVIRKTDFFSERTLGINADKASADFNREFVSKLQDSASVLRVKVLTD